MTPHPHYFECVAFFATVGLLLCPFLAAFDWWAKRWPHFRFAFRVARNFERRARLESARIAWAFAQREVMAAGPEGKR